jgi:hypothetical protein
MANLDQSPPHRSSCFRFSIGGLFVLTLGICVGLAHWRLPYGSAASAMLIACGAWLVIGLTAEAVQGLKRLKGAKDSPPERGRAISEIRSCLGLVAMLVIAAVFDMAARFKWPALEGNHPDSWYSTTLLTESLLYLAFICIYWTPRPSGGWEQFVGIRIWRRMLDGLAVAAGIGCLSAMLLDKTWILTMVYIAIRGVENAQPWRWLGHEFAAVSTPAELVLVQFVSGGITTAVLFVVGTYCGAVTVCWGHRQRIWRLVLFTTSAACLAGTVWYLTWCRNRVLPAMSSVLPEVVGDQPAGNLFLAVVFVACAATAGATWLLQEPRNVLVGETEIREARARLLIDDVLVTWVCLTAVVVAIGNDAWNVIRYDSTLAGVRPQLDWLYSPQVAWAIVSHLGEWLELYNPVRLLRWAALLVLVRRLWHVRLGTSGSWPVLQADEGRKYAAAWFYLFLTLVLAGPVGAWWSMAVAFKWYFGL